MKLWEHLTSGCCEVLHIWQELQVNILNSNSLYSFKSFLKNLFFMIRHQNICLAYWYTTSVYYTNISLLCFIVIPLYTNHLCPTSVATTAYFLFCADTTPNIAAPYSTTGTQSYIHTKNHIKNSSSRLIRQHSHPCNADIA